MRHDAVGHAYLLRGIRIEERMQILDHAAGRLLPERDTLFAEPAEGTMMLLTPPTAPTRLIRNFRLLGWHLAHRKEPSTLLIELLVGRPGQGIHVFARLALDEAGLGS